MDMVTVLYITGPSAFCHNVCKSEFPSHFLDNMASVIVYNFDLRFFHGDLSLFKVNIQAHLVLPRVAIV